MSCSIFTRRTTRPAAPGKPARFAIISPNSKSAARSCSASAPIPAKSHDKFVGEIQAALHTAGGRGQKDCGGLRRLGRKNLHVAQIHGHVPGDVSHRAGRPHQKNLAEGETGGTCGGSAGGTVIHKQPRHGKVDKQSPCAISIRYGHDYHNSGYGTRHLLRRVR